MALTGEAKREWRRKNRERIRAYTVAWLAEREVMELGYAARRAKQSVEVARQRRVGAVADREATEPMCAAVREHYWQRRSDPAYKSACAEAVRFLLRKPRKPRVSVYDGVWTHRVCGRILEGVRARCRRVSADPWKSKCETLARGLRYIQSKIPPPNPKKPRPNRTWDEQIQVLAGSLSSVRSRARPAKTPERAERRVWMKRASTIVGNMRYRRTLTLSAFKLKPRDILTLRDRQGSRCAYTGELLTPDNTGADHVIAVCAGGTHDPSNLALVLQQVNTAKGTMSLTEFVDMCRKVVARFGTEGDPVAILRAGEEVAV